MWKNEKEIFSSLNDRLSRECLNLEVICVGGFVLSHNGMRATQDIDGFFESNMLIESIIAEVGNEFGINTDDELWLNNSVQNMNELPDKTICELLYDYSNLKVYMVPLDYVAGMKLLSCREQDIIDVASIIRSRQISNPPELVDKLAGYGLSGFDESVVLEAFGQAYGMKWLQNYFEEHEEEILKSLK